MYRFDANRAECRIWTADKVVLRKLGKRSITPYRSSTTEGVESGWWVRVPYKAFRWSIKAGGWVTVTRIDFTGRTASFTRL